VRKWTQDYKETVLEPMMSDRADGAAKSAELAGALAELRENHTDTTVSFTLKFASDAAAAAANKVGLHKALKLSSSISTSNMTLFDAQGRIQKYEAVEAVLRDFYALRLSFYEKRKLHLQDKLTGEWSKLDNRMRFVLAVISGELKIANRKKADLVAELAQKGYAPFEPAPKRAAAGDDGEEEAAGEAEGGASASARGYDYLLSMPLWSLTRERVEQLRGECTAKEAELQTLLATSPRQLWAADLDAFEAGLAEWEAALEAPAEGAAAKARKGGAKGGRKKKAYDSDVEMESDSDYEDKPKKKKAPPKRKAPAAAAAPEPVFSEEVAPPAAPLVQKERKVAKPKGAPKAAPSAAADAPPVEEKEEEPLSLMERLARKAAAASHGTNWSAMIEDAQPDKPARKLGAAKPAASKPAAAKRPAKKAAAVADSDEESEFDGSDASDAGPAAPAAPRAAPRRAAAAAAKKYAAPSDDDSDGSEDASENESEPSASPLPKPKAKRPCKKPSPLSKAAPSKAAAPPRDVLDLDASDESDAEPVAAKKAPPKKAPAKAAALKAAAPKAAAPKAAKKPAKKKAADSDDDDYAASDDGAPSKPAPARGGAPRRAAAAAAVKKSIYADDSDEESGSESDFMD